MADQDFPDTGEFGRFIDESICPARHALTPHSIAREARHHYDSQAGLGKFFADSPYYVKARALLEIHVDQRNVGNRPFDAGDGLALTVRAAHYLDTIQAGDFLHQLREKKR